MKQVMTTCPECEGEGKVYIDTSHSCTKMPWSECCGGCGYDVDCEDCSGSGEVELEFDDITTESDGRKWMGLCNEHQEDVEASDLEGSSVIGGHGICCAEGCDEEATYYFDFK